MPRLPHWVVPASPTSSNEAAPTHDASPNCLSAEPDVVVLNDVVLNQVLVRFLAPGGGEDDHDARTRAVIAAVQNDGTCWLGGSMWRGQAVMRISVSNYSTTEADVEASVASILAAARSQPVPA